MKSLLALFFILSSSGVLSASVTIELDTGLTVGSFEYIPDEALEAWDELEVAPSLLDSFKYRDVTFIGNVPEDIWEGRDLSFAFFYEDSGLLNRTTITRLGVVDNKVFPAIENAITDYVSVEGVPYILDGTSNKVFVWSDTDDFWKDLSEEVVMPNGEITGLYKYSNNPVVETEHGLWLLATGSTFHLSPISKKDSAVVMTSDGYFQIVIGNVDMEYKANRFSLGSEANVSLESMYVNSEDYVINSTAFGETGSITTFKAREKEEVASDGNVEDLVPYLYVWSTPNGHELIQPPYNSKSFKGCFSTYPQLFCVFEGVDNKVVLFELKEGTFRADTVIANMRSLLGYEIESIKVMGNKRYGVLRKASSLRAVYSLLVADDISSRLISAGDFGVDFRMFALNSLEFGVVNVFGYTDGVVKFIKLKHAGEIEFKENTFAEADQYIFVEGRDSEEKIIPRAEIAGHFSFVILTFILMLLSVRRPLAFRRQ